MSVYLIDKRRRGQQIPPVGIPNHTWFCVLDIDGMDMPLPIYLVHTICFLSSGMLLSQLRLRWMIYESLSLPILWFHCA